MLREFKMTCEQFCDLSFARRLEFFEYTAFRLEMDVKYRTKSATRRAAGEITKVCGEPGMFVGVEKSKLGITSY
jgi:hypothetical protein